MSAEGLSPTVLNDCQVRGTDVVYVENSPDLDHNPCLLARMDDLTGTQFVTPLTIAGFRLCLSGVALGYANLF